LIIENNNTKNLQEIQEIQESCISRACTHNFKYDIFLKNHSPVREENVAWEFSKDILIDKPLVHSQNKNENFNSLLSLKKQNVRKKTKNINNKLNLYLPEMIDEDRNQARTKSLLIEIFNCKSEIIKKMIVQ